MAIASPGTFDGLDGGDGSTDDDDPLNRMDVISVGSSTGTNSTGEGISDDWSWSEPETQSSDDDALVEEVGSANLNIGIDEETGRAEESLSGQGSTGGSGGNNTTGGAEREDNISFDAVQPEDSIADVEKSEQAAEEATGGKAFGSPDVVDDIGSGTAVRELTDGVSNLFGSTPGGSQLAELDLTWKHAAAALVVGAVVLGGSNG